MNRSWLYFLLCTFGLSILANGWIADDAYISFRVIDNFLSGYGLTWNTHERVQVFTHPLWLCALIPLVALSGSVYWSAVSLSVVCSVGAMGLILKRSSSSLLGLLLVALCLSSQAFRDYSLSGLENPLSHLLLALFVSALFAGASSARLVLLASLVTLNRFDLALLCLPACAFRVFCDLRQENARVFLAVMLATSPFVGWLLFSTWYYGFPFPNTAYAKLSTGIPRGELIEQGAAYLWSSLLRDFVTPVVIVLGVLSGLISKKNVSQQLAVGVLLYVLYTVWVGGDFMLGRFLAAPFFISVILIGGVLRDVRPGLQQGAVIAGLLLAGFSLFSPFYEVRSGPLGNIDARKISDERAGYLPATGVLNVLSGLTPPESDLYHAGVKAASKERKVYVEGSIGYFGYGAGPHVKIIDEAALSDALLARLPSREDPNWRVGHYYRTIPKGYLNSVRSGENLLRDKKLAAYWENLRILTEGDLWSLERVKQMVEFNLGKYDHYVNQDRYRRPK